MSDQFESGLGEAEIRQAEAEPVVPPTDDISDSGTERPLPFDGEVDPAISSDPLLPNDEIVPSEPLPKTKDLKDQLQDIEENDNPDKFGQRVELYREATIDFVGGQDVTVQQFLESEEEFKKTGKEPRERDTEFADLTNKITQIFTEYSTIFQRELEGLSGDQAKLKAVEIIGKFTGKPIPSEQITFVTEDGQVNEEAFKAFISENTNVSHLVEEFVKLHDLAKVPMKEGIAVQDEMKSQLAAIESEDISDEQKQEKKKTVTEQYDAFLSGVERNMDMATLINTLFAIDKGYSNIRSAFNNGLEKKDDNRESVTLAALKKTFASSTARNTFFSEMLQISPDKKLTRELLQTELTKFLLIDKNISPEDKQKKVLEIKQRMFKGFEKTGKSEVLLSLSSAEDINLSSNVIKSLVLEAEKES